MWFVATFFGCAYEQHVWPFSSRAKQRTEFAAAVSAALRSEFPHAHVAPGSSGEWNSAGLPPRVELDLEDHFEQWRVLPASERSRYVEEVAEGVGIAASLADETARPPADPATIAALEQMSNEEVFRLVESLAQLVAEKKQTR